MTPSRPPLTVARHLHAAQTVALHQRASQRLVTRAFAQTAPTGLTNQRGLGAGPSVKLRRRFCNQTYK